MVRWMRTARLARGNMMTALSWAVEIAGYAEKSGGFPKIDVFVDSFGEGGTVRWMIDFDDLAALEKAQSQLRTNQEYWEKLEKAQHMFIEGSFYDVVTRSLT